MKNPAGDVSIGGPIFDRTNIGAQLRDIAIVFPAVLHVIQCLRRHELH
jgi:hypothetical protein